MRAVVTATPRIGSLLLAACWALAHFAQRRGLVLLLPPPVPSPPNLGVSRRLCHCCVCRRRFDPVPLRAPCSPACATLFLLTAAIPLSVLCHRPAHCSLSTPAWSASPRFSTRDRISSLPATRSASVYLLQPDLSTTGEFSRALKRPLSLSPCPRVRCES